MDDLCIWLVVYQPLWKIWKSIGTIIPNIWKNKTCSKPPTRQDKNCHCSTLQLSFLYNGLEQPCMRQCRNHHLGVPGSGVSYGKLGRGFYSVIFHVCWLTLEGISIKERHRQFPLILLVIHASIFASRSLVYSILSVVCIWNPICRLIIELYPPISNL